MAESFEFTKLDDGIDIGIAILQSIAIGIAILFLKIVLVLVLAILLVGCIGIAIANSF